MVSDDDSLLLCDLDHRFVNLWHVDGERNVACQISTTHLFKLWDCLNKTIFDTLGVKLHWKIITGTTLDQSVESVLVYPKLLSVSAFDFWEVGMWCG